MEKNIVKSKEELEKWVEEWKSSKTSALVDCRLSGQFFDSHLSGSTNIPFNEFSERSGELPPRGSSVCLLSNSFPVHQDIEKYLIDHDYKVDLSIVIDDDSLISKLDDTSKFVTNSSTSKIIWEPSPVLKGVIDRIEEIRKSEGLDPHGKAVDLACGSGRDCVFLAHRRWISHGYDYLDNSLERAHSLAERYNTKITTTCLDLEKDEDNLVLEKADLVNVSRYLHRPLMPKIAEMVNPGGFIVYHQFMIGCTKPRRERFLLAEGELSQTFTSMGFEVLEDEVFKISDGRPCSWFLARKLKK